MNMLNALKQAENVQTIEEMDDKKKKSAICNMIDTGWGFGGTLMVYHMRYADWKRLFPSRPKRHIVIKHLTWASGEMVEREVNDFVEEGIYLVLSKKKPEGRQTLLCFENQEFYFMNIEYYIYEKMNKPLDEGGGIEYLLKYKRQTKIEGLLK